MKDYYSVIPLQTGISKFKSGFHLQVEMEKEEERSVTGSSLHYKQRIDSMFDDRSVISGFSQKSQYRGHRQKTESISYNFDQLIYNKSCEANEVQDQINKMFQEVNLSEVNKNSSTLKSQQFPVSYLGSINLHQKVGSLRELQSPLKELYFKYMTRRKMATPQRGSLEITEAGLKIKFDSIGQKSKPKEHIHFFPSIAVWAAVKFVHRKKDSFPTNSELMEYAFMPLIADPESVDKISLYQSLSSSESNLLCEGDFIDNLPLFTVVIKETKNFECLGFICSSSNDAIIIAANLYTALVQAMPVFPQGAANKNINISFINEPPVMHIPKTKMCEQKASFNSIETFGTDKPIRPPRSKTSRQKSNYSSDSCSNFSSDESNEKKIICSHSFVSGKGKITDKRRNSEFKLLQNKDFIIEKLKSTSAENSVKMSLSSIKLCPESQDVGDILTKVAIPRSKSFLNASGPFCSRYTKGLDGLGGSTDTTHHRKNSVGSPLGLNELFQEFKQEGLYSMNDILDAIIDPDGMSFNELKPIYKEFVLKLALTLTKDELYQRSKSIMQKQKHKRRQINRRDSCNIKKSFTPGYALRKALRRSVSNFKLSKYKQSSFELTSVIFPSCGDSHINKKCSKSTEESFSLSLQSSVMKRKENRGSKRQKKSGNSKANSRKSSYFDFNQYNNIPDKLPNNSDVLSDLKGKRNLHHSSSGYFSCSECSYSSNSCTCTSADRCYCSLGRREKYNINGSSFLVESDEYSPCECDTDSCFESDKCYCSSITKSTSFSKVREQSRIIRQQSLGSSSNFLSNSMKSSHENIFKDINGACNKNTATIQISNSIESLYMEESSLIVNNKKSFKNDIKSSPIESQHERISNSDSHKSILGNSIKETKEKPLEPLTLDYDLFDSAEKVEESEKVLIVSARDPSGKVVFMGTTCQNQNVNVTPVDLHSTASNEEALSVKKSAEIAALFGVTDDIIYNTLEPPDDFKEQFYKKSYADSNLESSLGYLP